MAAITIRDVPEENLNRLKLLAAQAGQSLQSYVLGLIKREAEKPTLAEMSQRAERYATLQLDNEELLSVIDEGRSRR
ncbi:antitoxin [Streptomyces sp. CS014]|uniref:FitA-like ribbon-helix-helix domain-containing protein n=1 Tax=Streptomyces sp. CS014 TaxID=2162707 RepID=UPI000D51413D|nr:antitoxin [Streptomyces sp. CS014]PVD04505.1 antitoxin [Streptomyces sp. CS014]